MKIVSHPVRMVIASIDYFLISPLFALIMILMVGAGCAGGCDVSYRMMIGIFFFGSIIFGLFSILTGIFIMIHHRLARRFAFGFGIVQLVFASLILIIPLTGLLMSAEPVHMPGVYLIFGVGVTYAFVSALGFYLFGFSKEMKGMYSKRKTAEVL